MFWVLFSKPAWIPLCEGGHKVTLSKCNKVADGGNSRVEWDKFVVGGGGVYFLLLRLNTSIAFFNGSIFKLPFLNFPAELF